MNNYLIKYLRDNASSELSAKYIDFFKIELDWHIYNSERHIAESHHRNKRFNLTTTTIKSLQYLYALSAFSGTKPSDGLNVLSTVFFSDPNTLPQLGFNSYTPVWNPIGKKNIYGDFKTIMWHEKIQKLICKDDFFLSLASDLHNDLENFQSHLVSQYLRKDFRALLLHTDENFYSKYFIEVFKKMNRPSVIFSHGLPGIYSANVDNRSDYLMVWSEKIRQNYINIGFDPSKIKAIGNPKFKFLKKSIALKSDLSDVLIIPVSSATWHQHEYDAVLTDKSTVVLYLYKVQNVLKRLGVKKARYRVHPAMNKQWVHAFLDPGFYIIDDENLSVSLSRTSLVIGATSTVLLESLINGLNYIVFEPKDEEGLGLLNFKLVPPFDGSEEKVMMANDEDELEKMLRYNAMTDYSLVHDYIQDFDPAVLKEIID